MDTPLPESCRQVQGSRQEIFCITPEQRTEGIICRLRRLAPDTVPLSVGASRNKSGTAEVNSLCLLSKGQRLFYLP